MKIARHTDGSYSLTQMRREDVEALLFGACSAEAFYAKGGAGPGVDHDPAWNAKRTSLFHRLYMALNVAACSSRRGSMNLSGEYHVVTQRGLEPWSR